MQGKSYRFSLEPGVNVYPVNETFNNYSDVMVFARSKDSESYNHLIQSSEYDFVDDFIAFELEYYLDQWESIKLFEPRAYATKKVDFNSMSDITPGNLEQNFNELFYKLQELEKELDSKVVKVDSKKTYSQDRIPLLQKDEIHMGDRSLNIKALNLPVYILDLIKDQNLIPGEGSGEDGRTAYLHIAYADGPNGEGFSKNPTNKAYLGQYTDFSLEDSDNPNDYVWMRILGDAGPPGKDGLDGSEGLPGVPSYFHIAYADDKDGNGFSQIGGTKKFMGTYVDDNPIDSNNPDDYNWFLILEEGPEGIPGVDGSNGETSYLHIAYADDKDGGGFSQDPDDKLYMGTYVDFVKLDSSDPTRYKWTRVQGFDGDQGIPGVSSYFHIAYADTINGDGFSQEAIGKAYLGTYVDEYPTDSNNPGDYKWMLVAGLDGEQGIPGVDGDTGETSYLHIAYAEDLQGNGFTQIPGDLKYMGTYVDFIQADSNDPDDYTWTRIQGFDGADGADGADGLDGIGAALSNDSHILECDKNGSVISYSSATGTFFMYRGNTLLAASYSKVSQSGGSFTINQTTGEYACTNMSANVATAIFKATYEGYEISKIYTVMKTTNIQAVNDIAQAKAKEIDDKLGNGEVVLNSNTNIYGIVNAYGVDKGIVSYNGATEGTSTLKTIVDGGEMSYLKKVGSDWITKKIFKSSAMGIGKNNDIVDLRNYSNGIPWNSHRIVVAANEITLPSGVLSWKAYTESLGDDRYRIKGYASSEGNFSDISTKSITGSGSASFGTHTVMKIRVRGTASRSGFTITGSSKPNHDSSVDIGFYIRLKFDGVTKMTKYITPTYYTTAGSHGPSDYWESYRFNPEDIDETMVINLSNTSSGSITLELVPKDTGGRGGNVTATVSKTTEVGAEVDANVIWIAEEA